MSLAFYMDHHVPSAVTKGLRQRGLDVLTAYEDGHFEIEDERLLERATELGRVLYTHDDDFLRISDAWQNAGRSFRGVVYAHQENVSVGKAIDDLELIAKTSEPEHVRNEVQYIPL